MGQSIEENAPGEAAGLIGDKGAKKQESAKNLESTKAPLQENVTIQRRNDRRYESRGNHHEEAILQVGR